jgi:hypothetical protein
MAVNERRLVVVLAIAASIAIVLAVLFLTF